MGAGRGPAHLLLLDHALADHLVDRGLGERGGDGLAGAAAFAVVGDAAGVGAQIGVELAYRLEQLDLCGTGLFDVEVDLEVLDGVQGAEDVAVPAEPLQPLQLVADLRGEIDRSAWGTPGPVAGVAGTWPCWP